jgi:hypothetical protein
MAATDQADTTAVPAEPFDASDEAQVNRRKRDAGRRKKEAGDVLVNLLAKPAGRAWLWGLMAATHMFETSFVQNDPTASAFREGERNIGLRILGEVMRIAPDSFVLMMKENGGRG